MNRFILRNISTVTESVLGVYCLSRKDRADALAPVPDP